MKTMILVAALLLTGRAAHAETITLTETDCGVHYVCEGVSNSAGVAVDIAYGAAYGQVTVVIDGVTYDSGRGSAATPPFVNLPLYSDDGAQILLSAAFTTYPTKVSYKTCTHSGRGQTCTLHWIYVGQLLSDGTIVR